MVDVNRVYQTVLNVLNKEQRGYITPEEFNRYAIQAQKEIYDGYFFKLGRATAQGAEIDPMVENIPYDIYEKLENFEAVNILNSYVDYTTPVVLDSTEVYRLSIIQVNGVTVEKSTRTMIGNLHKSTLTTPTVSSPMYYRQGDNIFISGPEVNDRITIYFYIAPVNPEWTGTTLNGQIIPDISSTDFPLHSSEEPELVANILSYAGISVRASDVAQAGSQKAQQISQQES